MLLKYYFDSFFRNRKGGISSSKIFIFFEMLQKRCQKLQPKYILVSLIMFFLYIMLFTQLIPNIVSVFSTTTILEDFNVYLFGEYLSCFWHNNLPLKEERV